MTGGVIVRPVGLIALGLGMFAVGGVLTLGSYLGASNIANSTGHSATHWVFPGLMVWGAINAARGVAFMITGPLARARSKRLTPMIISNVNNSEVKQRIQGARHLEALLYAGLPDRDVYIYFTSYLLDQDESVRRYAASSLQRAARENRQVGLVLIRGIHSMTASVAQQYPQAQNVLQFCQQLSSDGKQYEKWVITGEWTPILTPPPSPLRTAAIPEAAKPAQIYPPSPPPTPVTTIPEEGDFTWEKFWVWASSYHLSSKPEIAYWLGASIDGLTPAQVRERIKMAASDRTVQPPTVSPPAVIQPSPHPGMPLHAPAPKPVVEPLPEREDEKWHAMMVEVLADPKTQRIQRQLVADINEYRSGSLDGDYVDDEDWTAFLHSHPVFHGFVQYFRSAHNGKISGGNAWTYSKEFDNIVEQYLFYCWV